MQLLDCSLIADSNSYTDTNCPQCRKSHKIFSGVANYHWKNCLNYLRLNHKLIECLSQSCKNCRKKHNTICTWITQNNNKSDQLPFDSENASRSLAQRGNISVTCTLSDSISNYVTNVENQVILPTEILFIQNRSGRRLKGSC